MSFSRRDFLAGGSAALIGLSLKSEKRIEGSFVNESAAAGHLLRDRKTFPPATQTVKIPVVIVGGGISGLSAAWRLQKSGFHDFVLLEMNEQAGGNARWGENEITAYPWAAHYVPVPGPQATYVRELFTDLGVLKDGKWEERYLAFAPQERLFLYGRWQEGIEPAVGLTEKDREQFQRLTDVFAKYRSAGAFTIPLEIGYSSKFADLDQMSLADWLKGQGFDSRLLNWYMNYACRDDYGALAKETSAWAGIHYFSSREAEEKGPLTWPEGNGWITKRLLERVGDHVRTDHMVHKLRASHRGVSVFAGETEYQAEFVIFSVPTFLAPYVVDGIRPLRTFVYSPWLTANLTLERLPESRGAEAAWDNGVPATLQLLAMSMLCTKVFARTCDRTVWTFYWALADGTPAQTGRCCWKKIGATGRKRSLKILNACTRHSAVRFAHRYHAHGACHGTAHGRRDLLRRTHQTQAPRRSDLDSQILT